MDLFRTLHNYSLLAVAALVFMAPSLSADVRLPAIFGDRMVLQQKQANPIWGRDEPHTTVTVEFADQVRVTTAGSDGRWRLSLDPMHASGQSRTLVVTGTTRREFRDVLVGEVWMCSGQSNMQLRLSLDWNGDVEAAASRFPAIRLITVPRTGSQELREDFKGEWVSANPETVASFSALGFLFGRYVHQVTGVPVGLIANHWAGSSAEAWVRRASLEAEPRFADLIARTRARETDALAPDAGQKHAAAMKRWEQAKAAGRGQRRPPENPSAWLNGFARAGNIFGAIVHPTLGYGIKGVVWYQGEGNSTRPDEYADLFPFLIEQWRREWGQGDFPFYWVQLPDWGREPSEPGDSYQARTREAQTRALRLPNTGQAVIIDLGEGKDRHPRNKHDVAARLVRWALVKDYGLNLPYRSPEFKSYAVEGRNVIVVFDCFGSKLRSFDVEELRGFAVCDANRVWHWATGRIVGPDRIELWSDAVPSPVAVRYAWADNPVCNLFSDDGLPVTPFRTDDYPFERRTDATEPDRN